MKSEKGISKSFEMSLRENKKASDFFNHCTPEQKANIISQANSISSSEAMKAFVEHLPSAAL
jgi:hypothetical protein